MGRLKARLAKNQVDRELHGQLAMARRSLEKAMDVCVRVARDRSRPNVRAKQTKDTLRRVLGMIDGVGYLHTQVEDEIPTRQRQKGKSLDEKARQLEDDNPEWLEEYLMRELGLELE